MKNFLVLLGFFITNLAFAQGSDIVVKAQKQTVTSSLDAENSDKIIVLNSHKKTLKTDKLVIYNSAGKQDGWRRSFIIYNEADAEIVKFTTPLKEKTYEIALKDLFRKTEKNKDYSIYTIALPTDQKKAATVRVRRVLICTLRVK